MNDLNLPWNKKEINVILEDVLLNKLKVLAKSGCRKCYGRGYTGYKEHKINNKINNEIKKVRQYIECTCVKD